MNNKLIEKIQSNKTCMSIIDDVEENIEKITIEFTVDEVIALHRTAFAVYNSFCGDIEDDDGLSTYMNRYLDDLQTAQEKLSNW